MNNVIINLNNHNTGIVNDLEIEKVLSDWNVSYNKKVIFEDSIHSVEGCQYSDKFFDIDISIVEMEDEEDLTNLLKELSEAGGNGSIKIDCYGKQFINDYLDNLK